MAVAASGCWTAEDNAHLYLSSTLDDKERSKLVKDGGAYSGIFKIDFLRNCALLGVVPHPQLGGSKRVKTVEDEAKERLEQERREKEGKEEDEPAVVTPLPLRASAPSPPPPAADGKSTKRATGGGKGRTMSAAGEKLTPAQRAAAELASAMSALSPEELKPITELSVRGWTLDVGTAAALQLTIPACKQLTTLRFWNASLTPRAITLLCDSLKGSAVTKLLLDYNPLVSEQGQEPGFVYSVLLAPSSPLQLVSLRGNAIDDGIACEIARTVCASKNLVVLDLFDNLIGDVGAEALSRTIGLNSTLQSLNLGHNRIGDPGARSLASAFQSVVIGDKEEAKVLKKAGFKITTLKNRTMREANQVLKHLNLSQNYLSEPGLRSWLDVANEQVKLTPSKGVVIVDGVEVQASTLVPAHLLAPSEAEEAAAAAAAAALAEALAAAAPVARKASRRTDSVSGTGTGSAGGSKPGSAASSSASAAASAAAAAAAAAKKEEEEMRYPGQLNNLVQVNLTRQYSKCTELTWHQLLHTPLIRWVTSSAEQWQEEGTLNAYAVDAAAAAEEERARLAAQSEEERLAAAAAAAEAAEIEAARVAAEAAAAAQADDKKKARKERKATKGTEG